MALTLEDVVGLCRRGGFRIDLINLDVGTLMVDDTGIVGRGSAATALAGGNVPVVQPDYAIFEAAMIFVVHPPNDKPFMLDREEFEGYCRER